MTTALLTFSFIFIPEFIARICLIIAIVTFINEKKYVIKIKDLALLLRNGFSRDVVTDLVLN